MSPDATGKFKGIAVPRTAKWPPSPLTTDEVAEYLRVTPATVARYCSTGKLRAARLGNSWRIRQEAVQEFLDAAEADTLPQRPTPNAKNGGRL